MGQNHTKHEPSVIPGVIADESGNLLNGAEVCLEKDDKVVARTLTDRSGRYEISIYPDSGIYDLSATWKKL